MSNVVGPFPGTNRELDSLKVAVWRHCTCAHTPPEACDPPCPVHQMLGDLNVLRHLIFVRRDANWFRCSEWDLDVIEP